MLLVGLMLFLEGDIPLAAIKVREESIGLLRSVVYFSQAKAVGKGQSLGIDTRAANDIDFLIFGTACEGCGKRGESLCSGEVFRASSEDDIPAIGQRTLRQAVECLAPHDDGMPCRQGLETFQVVG